jgi:hypothetical protein
MDRKEIIAVICEILLDVADDTPDLIADFVLAVRDDTDYEWAARYKVRMALRRQEMDIEVERRLTSSD